MCIRDRIQAPDDVIVSACPEIIREEICKRIGVKNYIGSVVDMENGIIERVCYKENKICLLYTSTIFQPPQSEAHKLYRISA